MEDMVISLNVAILRGLRQRKTTANNGQLSLKTTHQYCSRVGNLWNIELEMVSVIRHSREELVVIAGRVLKFDPKSSKVSACPVR